MKSPFHASQKESPENISYEDMLKRLKEERERLGLSQHDMGQCMHISQSHYCKVEAGFCRMTYDELKKLCTTEIDVNYIYTERRPYDSTVCWLHKLTFEELLYVLNIIYAIMKLNGRNNILERTFLKALRYVPALAETYHSENKYLLIRNLARVSQSAMAEDLGIDIKKLRKLEKGGCLPDSEIIFRLYKFYHVLPAIVLEDTKGLRSVILIILEMLDE